LLQENCRTTKDSWEIYACKHIPPFGRTKPDANSNIQAVERRGVAIVRKVQQEFLNVDYLSYEQLAQLIEVTDNSKFELEQLKGQLEGLPNLFK